jgi:CspA family cold shock protein
MESSANKRQSGVVKFFNPKKGFGFICLTTNHGVKDIFVHFSALSQRCGGCLNENQKVTFLISKGKKGFEAQDVDMDDNNC